MTVPALHDKYSFFKFTNDIFMQCLDAFNPGWKIKLSKIKVSLILFLSPTIWKKSAETFPSSELFDWYSLQTIKKPGRQF